MKTDKLNCPICRSIDQRTIITACDHLVTERQFSIVHCSGCDVRHTYPAPSPEELPDYYRSDEYHSHMDGTDTTFSLVYKLVRNIALRGKKRLIHRVTGLNSGNLLDIGCGTGEFPAQMKDAGWEITGVDTSETARRIAKEKFNITVHQQEILPTLKPDSFDVVTMWHSLEHLSNPGFYLKIIQSVLKDTGTLVVALPNWKSTDARYYGETWAAYDVPRHLFHYSRESITYLMAKSGFQLHRYRGMHFDPYYISMLSEKNRGAGGSLVRGFIIGLWSWITGLLVIDRSSSIVYVFQKKG